MEKQIKKCITCCALVGTLHSMSSSCEKCHENHQPHIPETNYQDEIRIPTYSTAVSGITSTVTTTTSTIYYPDQNYNI